jgi:hypothetical protein
LATLRHAESTLFITSPGETASAARRALGSVALAQDRSLDVWPWLDGFFHDLRFALRGLWRDRAFTLAAIAMLTLAIGLNVTVFTVMDAMLFRGYPIVKRNDRLVYLQERSSLGTNRISFADVEEPQNKGIRVPQVHRASV